MKIIVLAIILSATSAFAGQKRRPVKKPTKIVRAQLKSDRKALEEYLMGFDDLLEELTPEEEAQDLTYNKIIDNINAAVDSNEILGPIMLAICGDQKARRNGQQKYRLDPADITEVAEYNGKMVTAVQLMVWKDLEEEVSEEEFNQEFNTQFDDFGNAQGDDCIDGMKDEIRKQYPNIINVDHELTERFQKEVINRAKIIARDWNFLMENAGERYWQLQQEEHEFSLNRIYSEMNSRTDPTYRAAKDRPNQRPRSRVSI